MAIPNVPPFFDMNFVDKDGKLTTDGKLYNDQLSQVLNDIVIALNAITASTVSAGSVTINGVIAPSFTTAQILALSTSAQEGTIWYDNQMGKLKFKNGSGIQTITSTP